MGRAVEAFKQRAVGGQESDLLTLHHRHCQTDRDGLRGRAGAELMPCAGEMQLDRLLGDADLSGYLLGHQSARCERQALSLPEGEQRMVNVCTDEGMAKSTCNNMRR
jgi:hypothetical protein